MNKVDTSNWKEFKLCDLFQASNGVVDIKNQDIDGLGEYVVTSGFKNNGILGKSSIEAPIVASNTLTIDMFGSVFYRNYPYKMVTHGRIFSLSSDFLNSNNGMFFCTCLQKLLQNHSYDNMCSWNKIKNLTIKLPATTSNIPDWEYMDEYISRILKETETDLKKLRRIDFNPRRISTADWGMFKVGDLFDIRPTKFYKLNNDKLLDGTICHTPVIVNSQYNNGIGGYSKREPTESNIITFSDTTDSSTIFYHPYSFIGYPHVQGLYPKGKYKDKWDDNSYLFFVGAFSAMASVYNFSYKSKFTRKIASELFVPLPHIDREIDFNSINQYMKRLYFEEAIEEQNEEVLLKEYKEHFLCYIPIIKWMLDENKKIKSNHQLTKKQHVVPKKILKNFLLPNSVTLNTYSFFDKNLDVLHQNNLSFKVPKTICQYYCTYEKKGMIDNVLENEIGIFESRFLPIIDQIIETWKEKKPIEHLITKYNKEIAQFWFLQLIRTISGRYFFTKTMIYDDIEYVNLEDVVYEFNRIFSKPNVLSINLEKFYETISPKIYIQESPADEEFIISDNPVMFKREDCQKTNIISSLPIHPRLCISFSFNFENKIITTKTPDNLLVKMNNNQVQQVNKYEILNSFKWVISSSPFNKKNLKLLDSKRDFLDLNLKSDILLKIPKGILGLTKK